MPNVRPKTYTERVAVGLKATQRQILYRTAKARGWGIATLMRETALEQIGRTDLSFEDPEAQAPGGGFLERGAISVPGKYAQRAVVNLTRAQRVALGRAAAAEETALSSFLRAAAMRAAGVTPPKPAPEGKRKPGRPIGTAPRKN